MREFYRPLSRRNTKQCGFIQYHFSLKSDTGVHPAPLFKKKDGVHPAPLFKKKSGAGFTLVELVVVMVLMVLITGLTIVSLRSGEEELLLERSIHKIAQDSRNAIGAALKAKPHNCGGTKFGGYGVSFEPGSTTYVFFADCDETLKYEPADDLEEVFELEEGEEVFELEEGVRIQSVTPLLAGKLHILFVPPHPDVYINTDIDGPQAQIILELINDNSRIRTLTITNKGVVDID